MTYCDLCGRTLHGHMPNALTTVSYVCRACWDGVVMRQRVMWQALEEPPSVDAVDPVGEDGQKGPRA